MKKSVYKEEPVNVRLKIVGLWTAMLFIFAYVDIFAFFRKDILEDALVGKVAEFDINQTFLALTTAYILIPSLMVFLTLVLRAKTARILNIILPAIYALTIIAAAATETWVYYIIGSVVEVILLIAIMKLSVHWPKKE